ncbi:MAG TPA: ABC transporter permease, partial [Terriglobales bacterium]|nr:ABC transporter permease [Terriglobales bacterium]
MTESFHSAWLRLRSLFRRRRVDRDLDDEVAFHLAMREQRLRDDGTADARFAARRRFGNLTLIHEETRSMWTFAHLETFWQDLRYAVRAMAHTPMLAFVVVLSLALGIGANTAIFSVTNAALLRSLPVPEPNRLLLLEWHSKDWPRRIIDDVEGNGGRDAGGIMHSYSYSSQLFEYIRDHNHVFDNVVAFSANNGRDNIGLNGHAESDGTQAVSGNFFEGMGIPPAAGRSMTAADDSDSAPPVAMISYRFWQGKLGGDFSALGKTVTVNGDPVTVIGVLPPSFLGLEPGDAPDIWITLSLYR